MVGSVRQLQAQHIMVTVPKTLGQDALIAQVRAELEDDHVHMVLVVDSGGRLVTTIERDDLDPGTDDCSLASRWGGLEGRTVQAKTPVPTIDRMLSTGRRRLAVVDDDRRLRGLVCLKRSRSGYCSDEDLRARAHDVAR